MLQGVVEPGGTGARAAVPGYTCAGKTGTAQKLDRQSMRYSKRDYTSLFIGFTPVENPRLVISVIIHEPKDSIYGGVVAAPVFRNIAAQALPYLGVAPSRPDLERAPMDIRAARMARGHEVRRPINPTKQGMPNDA